MSEGSTALGRPSRNSIGLLQIDKSELREWRSRSVNRPAVRIGQFDGLADSILGRITASNL